jgi:hypothetical protein
MLKEIGKFVAFFLSLAVGTGICMLIFSDFFAIDRCVDHGGRWNYDARVCEGTRPSG